MYVMVEYYFDVAVMFTSINGEGRRAGQLAFFIRLKGCNLCCSYCDTRWASQPDTPAERMTADQILHAVRDSRIKNVTLTGGEPLEREGIKVLLEKLACLPGIRVEIETNGSIPLAPFCHIPNRPSFTMDYKLPDSGMEEYMCLDNFRILDTRDTVKFVAGSLSDCSRALDIIRHYDLTGRTAIYLSPVFGKIDPADMVNFMKEHLLNDVNLQIQMHKVIWDADKRGV